MSENVNEWSFAVSPLNEINFESGNNFTFEVFFSPTRRTKAPFDTQRTESLYPKYGAGGGAFTSELIENFWMEIISRFPQTASEIAVVRFDSSWRGLEQLRNDIRSYSLIRLFQMENFKSRLKVMHFNYAPGSLKCKIFTRHVWMIHVEVSYFWNDRTWRQSALRLHENIACTFIADFPWPCLKLSSVWCKIYGAQRDIFFPSDRGKKFTRSKSSSLPRALFFNFTVSWTFGKKLRRI